MNAAELIARLQQADPDAEVYLEGEIGDTDDVDLYQYTEPPHVRISPRGTEHVHARTVVLITPYGGHDDKTPLEAP